MPEWKWYGDPVYRYRDEKGNFVAYETIRHFGDLSIQATIEKVQKAALDGIPVADFEKLMREQIKAEVIRQYCLGIGGSGNLTKADYGVMGGVIADQYRYLNDFIVKIQNGEYSPSKIAALAAMYINSTREAYERANARCRGLPQMPAYPGDGSCLGLTNCKCHWDYHFRKGRWECYWRLGDAEHCELCIDHQAEWSPLLISKEGEFINE